MNAVDPAFHRGNRPAAPLCARTLLMAEAIREITCRDGAVTEPALVGEGFTAAEIVELFPDALSLARRAFAVVGARGDRVPDIIEKAIAGQAWAMPITAGTAERETMRLAWRDYCTALAAYKIDPWLSQGERCLVRLKVFLGLLPLLPVEINRVTNGVASAFKRRTRVAAKGDA